MSFQRKPFKGGYSSFSKKPAKGLKPGKGFVVRKPALKSDAGQAAPLEAEAVPQAKPDPGFKPNSSFKPKAGSAFDATAKTGRAVDARKARKVLRALEQTRAEALANGKDLSSWETEFLGSVENKIETYGSAFRDPLKGRLEEPISTMQRVKLKEIHAKASGPSKDRAPGNGKTGKK